MGSTSSKDAGSSSLSPSAASGFRRSRSIGSRVFQSSCLGSRSLPTDFVDQLHQVSDSQSKEKGSLRHLSACLDQDGAGTNQVKQKGYRKSKLQQKPNEVPPISSDTNEWDQETISNSTYGVDTGTSQALSSRSLTSSSRSRTRFSFIPGNISFRLSRAAGLGSSRACSLFSNGFIVSDSEDLNVHSGPSASSANRNGTHQGCESFPVCNTSHLPAQQYEDNPSSDASRLNPITSRLSIDLQNDEIVSTSNTTRNNENMEILADVNNRSPRNHIETECIETRRATRRIAAREPVERSVRFSRTLSVGRLRDRVLRRSSLTDGVGRAHDDGEEGDTSQIDGRQVWGGTSRALDSDGNAEISPVSSNYPPPRMPNSIYDNENELETTRPREARYHDIMEHRTDFLERRRRIRSQVRALQRLGSRFENLSGHERSCILSGQHRTGHCSCRTSNRNRNPDDDTSARASISRIVMLAEALFEVLDEIHQQSVVLSSRPSVTPFGSVPAPKEVVESMPVKIFTELQKLQSEDIPQCYICLLEYEEGDCMRILPCHHEFHRVCIDKWLKEIHRVCPLCRGDVCRSDSLPPDN